MELAIGTPIRVRTIQAIDSRTADVNRTYAASLAEPLFVGGTQVAPRNADVRLRVVEDNHAGAVSGRATLVLQVASIRINGQMIPVDTGTSVKESGSQGEKTATRGIVGGILGAAIGAAAGGGKGAAIGAGAGSAAGVASAVMSGEQVRVRPETRLDFSLNAPVTVPPPGAYPPPASTYEPPPPQQPRYDAPMPPTGGMMSQRLGGWIMSVDRCVVSPDQSGVECRFSIADERRGREVWVGTEQSKLREMDGREQYASSVCLGPGRCLPDWARTRVYPEAPVSGRIYFGRIRPADTLDRLRIRLRWEGRDESVEFRGVRVEQGR